MQNLDELKAAADKAAARHEAWKAALDAAEAECAHSQQQMHELLNEAAAPGEMAAVGDKIALLLGRIDALQMFLLNYKDSGIRHEVSTRRGTTAYAYIAAKKEAEQARQKLVDEQFAARQAQAQFEGTQAQSGAPKLRKTGRVAKQGANA